jgi:hypothetical protein
LSPRDHAAYTSDPIVLARAVFRDAESVRRHRRRLLQATVAASALVLVVLFFAALGAGWHFDDVWRYEAVALMGASVGTAELLSRYRDAPSFVLLSPPGMSYVLINALASVGALAIVLGFGWTFGAEGDAALITQVLLAGFGSMALFRSSLLTVKAGGEDVGIGPSSVLSIMMAASDRSADRLRAADRAGRVRAIMQDVAYAKARASLPTVAIALMQNLGPGDAAALEDDISALDGKPLPDATKSMLLGLMITDVVSTAVLGAAKESLGASILVDGREPAAPRADTPVGEAPRPLVIEDEVARLAAALPSSASEGLPQTPQTPGRPPAGKRVSA